MVVQWAFVDRHELDRRLNTLTSSRRRPLILERWRLRWMRDPWRRIAKLQVGLKLRPGHSTLTAHLSM